MAKMATMEVRIGSSSFEDVLGSPIELEMYLHVVNALFTVVAGCSDCCRGLGCCK